MVAMTDTKVCSKCGEEKPLTAFYGDKKSPCKDCRKVKAKQRRKEDPEGAKQAKLRWLAKPENAEHHKQLLRNWYEANKERAKANNRKNHLRTHYNLTPKQFERLLEQQNHLCAACKEPFNENETPYVDHDHGCCAGNRSCGNCIRGLVHHKCNIVMAFALDSPEILRRIADYVEQTSIPAPAAKTA